MLGQTISTPESTSPSVKRLTFEEYRFYDDGTDIRYELFRGKLIPMPNPSGLHSKICRFLAYRFQQYIITAQLPLVVVSDVGVRTENDSSRIPDIVVCQPHLWEQVCQRKGAGVLDLNEAATLVVEVTSNNWREDYIRKGAEYALIEIDEYWIVDPQKQRVRVLIHPEKDDGYDFTDFEKGQTIISQQFAQLSLTVDELLSPPVVEDLLRADQEEYEKLEQQVIEEQQRAEQERLRAEQQQQRAEQERLRAEQERQRADRMAALLREQGINPDELS